MTSQKMLQHDSSLALWCMLEVRAMCRFYRVHMCVWASQRCVSMNCKKCTFRKTNAISERISSAFKANTMQKKSLCRSVRPFRLKGTVSAVEQCPDSQVLQKCQSFALSADVQSKRFPVSSQFAWWAVDSTTAQRRVRSSKIWDSWFVFVWTTNDTCC